MSHTGDQDTPGDPLNQPTGTGTTRTTNLNKDPPSLQKSKNYDDWVKLITAWKDYTTIPPEKQGIALLLSLEGEAQDAVLELPTEELKSQNGLDNAIQKLDGLFKRDDVLKRYGALEEFELYKRFDNISMQKYIIEFEKRLNKTKSYGTTWSDDLLAFRLLRSANLSEQHQQLAKATITDLTYINMKQKLKNIFGESTIIPTASATIKVEDINYAQQMQTHDESPCNNNEYLSDYLEHTELESSPIENNTYYQNRLFYPSRGGYRGRYPRSQGFNSSYQQRPNRPVTPQNFNVTRGDFQNQSRAPSNRLRGRNPTTRCAICQSINHWAQRCPDRNIGYSNQTGFTSHENEEYPNQTCFSSHGNEEYNEIVLFQSDYDYPAQLQTLVAESWNAALLDSGASKTVCGKLWLNEYLSALPDEKVERIKFRESNSVYKFGDGQKVGAHASVDLPATINKKKVTIRTDVVENEIPLLLSKATMKRANTLINFEDDTAIILGEKVNLISTQSGHYALPLTENCRILNDVSVDPETTVVLVARTEKQPEKIAKKLHQMFAHPPDYKMIDVINRAGEPWSNNDELKEEIKKVSADCTTCQVYGKAKRRPVVGLPIATKFLECAAMDLKFYRGRIILHIIDYATRLSQSCIVPSKKPTVIVEAILKTWVSVFGSCEKFLTDNGGEFANEEFLSLCESFNINVKVTAAESPFSNGIVERHNLVLSEMLDKVLEETNCNIHVALTWCTNAKNSLNNVHGFSPYQLAIGTNPKLPSNLVNKLPALTQEYPQKVLADNLSALHKAREAFIQAEHSERLNRAMRHNIRTSSNIPYLIGDYVYYKRSQERRWRGPAIVLGKDGQQFLLKHGSYYQRVHHCHLKPAKRTNDDDNSVEQEQVQLQTTNQTEPNDDDEDAEEVVEGNPSAANVTEVPASQSTESPNVRNSQETTSEASATSLQKNLQVKFKVTNDQPWQAATILTRAGKATGRYPKAWNVKLDDGNKMFVDFDRIDKWEPVPTNNNNDTDATTSATVTNGDSVPDSRDGDSTIATADAAVTHRDFMPESEDEIQLNETYTAEIETEQHNAKMKELRSWKEQKVYTEVDDEGQQCVSVRWVIRPKIIDGQMSTKARLVARGFEEDATFRTDSPNSTKEGLRVVLSVISSLQWTIKSIDVVTAFLQGKPMEREVYIRPPTEACTDKIWRLNKCVYGLSDASRHWYITLREQLISFGAVPSVVDKGIFYWYDNQHLIGIILAFTDDLLKAGTNEFEQNVIQPLKTTFTFAPESSEIFTYIGIDIAQNGTISINQQNYIQTIKCIPLSALRLSQQHDPVTEEERTLFRAAIGQLNWVAGVARPEISFHVSVASSKVKTAVVSDLISINKVIQQVKNTPSSILYPRMDRNSLFLKTYTDASFNNLEKGGSQGAHITFICDKHGNSAPISWSSTRIKRVVRSTLAAETVALMDGCDAAFYVAKLVEETTKKKEQLESVIVTDSRSLYNTINTTHLVDDKRLRVELSGIRELVERNEVSVRWISKRNQLSDVLTKKGASPKSLLESLQNGHITIDQ